MSRIRIIESSRGMNFPAILFGKLKNGGKLTLSAKDDTFSVQMIEDCP